MRKLLPHAAEAVVFEVDKIPGGALGIVQVVDQPQLGAALHHPVDAVGGKIPFQLLPQLRAGVGAAGEQREGLLLGLLVLGLLPQLLIGPLVQPLAHLQVVAQQRLVVDRKVKLPVKKDRHPPALGLLERGDLAHLLWMFLHYLSSASMSIRLEEDFCEPKSSSRSGMELLSSRIGTTVSSGWEAAGLSATSSFFFALDGASS